MSTPSAHTSSFAAAYEPNPSYVQPAQTSSVDPKAREYISLPQDLAKLLTATQKAIQLKRSVERSNWQAYATALGNNAEEKQAWLETMRMSEAAGLPETPEIVQRRVYELLEKFAGVIVSTTNPRSVQRKLSMEDACALLNEMEKEKHERKWRQQLYHLDINKALGFSEAGRQEWWADIAAAKPAEQVKKLDDGPTTIYEFKNGTV